MSRTSDNLDETVAQSATPGVVCPQCGARLIVDGLPPGTRLLCGGCGASNVLPAASDTRRSSRKAIASLICGVGAFVATCVASLPAIVLGVMALRELKRSQRELKGRGLALAGIWLGVLVPLVCSPVHIAFILPAVQAMRGRAIEQSSDDGQRMPSESPESTEIRSGGSPEKN